MIVSIIAAVSSNNVIGKGNDLPWHLPIDMKYFKDTTAGRTVIMGRKNWFSIPEKYRPLPNRTNIVISRSADFFPDRGVGVNSIEQALDYAKTSGETNAFIIGGGEIYKQSLHLANQMHITWIHNEFEGDTYFPQFEPNDWKEISRKEYEKNTTHKHAFSICIYEKRG